MTLHIVYTSDGEAVGDEQIMPYALSKWKMVEETGQPLEVKTSNYHVILGFRLLVKRGEIPFNNVRFYYQSSENLAIKIDSKGELSHYPKGFCDVYSDLLIGLI